MLEASLAAPKTHEIPVLQAISAETAYAPIRYFLAPRNGTLHEPARKSGKNPGSDVPVLFEEPAHD